MRKIFPLALIVAGLFLISATIGYWRFDEAIKYPSAAPLPEQVTDLPLAGKSTGQQAVWELTRLHQKGFPLASAAVGMYGTEHQVTLWVSGAPIRSLAGRMLATMRDKIGEGRSPFTSLGELKDGNRLIYELEGMGQRHYYFQSGKLLIWMAASPELADQALAEVLKFYP
jgi:hypothetical protein